MVVAGALYGHRIRELLGAEQAIVAVGLMGVVAQGPFRLAGLATTAAGKGAALWLELRAAISTVPAIHMTLTRLTIAKVARTSGHTVP